MNWKKWKVGLVVSALNGACQSAIAWAADSGLTLRGAGIIFGANVAAGIMLYLKQHPVESIDTDFIVKPPEK